MKKITTHVLLFVGLLLAAVQSRAESYGIYIGGVQLSSDLTSMSHKSHPEIISNAEGTVTYDATANELTFSHATLQPSSDHNGGAVFIDRSIIAEGLTIRFVGSCSVYATNSLHALMLYGYYDFDPAVNIVGEDSQTRLVGQNTGIYCYNDVTVNISGFNGKFSDANSVDGDECFLFTQGGTSNTGPIFGYGISGMSGNVVNVLGARVMFNGTTRGVNNVEMNVKNAERYDDRSWKSGNVTYYQVGTTPLEEVKYDIWVAGTQVTSFNADQVESPFLGQGTISYDADTKTLTLRDVAVTALYSEENWRQQTGIMADAKDLQTISLEGENVIVSDDYIPLYLYSTVQTNLPTVTIDGHNQAYLLLFYGEGKNRIYQPALGLSGVHCVLKDIAWGFLLGYENCIAGNENIPVRHHLTIRNSAIELFSNYALLENIGILTLEECHFSTPEEAVFNENKMMLGDGSGNELRGYASIALGSGKKEDMCYVPMMAAGVGVPWPKDASAWDFAELARQDGCLRSGDIAYDGNTNTLTLIDADIEAPYGGVYSWTSEPFRLKVVGNCTIRANSAAVGAWAEFTIEGDGADKSSLTVVSDEDFAIWTWGPQLNIKNVTLNATGLQYGLYGFGYVVLNVEGSVLNAQCTDFASAKAVGKRPAKVVEIRKDGHVVPLPAGVLAPETSTTGVESGAICDFKQLKLSGGSTLPAGYRYDETKKSVINENGEVTRELLVEDGIAELTTAVPAQFATYTLQGVRTSTMQQKGIYIVNGKKVVRK